MEIQGYKIIPPEGMECYLDGSEIKFRPIENKPEISCYDDITRKLFEKEMGVYITSHCVSQKQAKKALAINKLLNIAKYLNDGWVPDWNNSVEQKYYIYINILNNIDINYALNKRESIVYFRTEELARKAIEILGEKTIRLIFSTNY